MIFAGDVAMPNGNNVNLKNFPSYLKNKNWIVNLEGGLLTDIDLYPGTGVFNGFDSFCDLNKKININMVTLANNHITDNVDLSNTIELLNKISISYVGAGLNETDARKEKFIDEEDHSAVILNFGWSVIQCKSAKIRKKGTNRLTKNNVIKSVKDAVSKYPKKRVVCVMHWGYELEGEPQPFERELARVMIDLGCDAVVGHHSHRLGGYEIYKNKPIVYGLGNFLFKRKFYNQGKINFPDFCNLQMTFELDLKSLEHKFHFFTMNPEDSSVDFICTEDQNSEIMKKHTPFKNLNTQEYEKWYKKNHFHKNKGLPIYYWSDSKLIIKIKNIINLIRDKFLIVAIKLLK